MQYGYIRTEPNSRSFDIFTKEMEPFSPAQIFIDRNLPGDKIQPELTKLLELLQPHDTVVTHACTTFSPDEAVFQKVIASIRNKHCSVRFLDLSDHGMKNPAAKLQRFHRPR